MLSDFILEVILGILDMTRDIISATIASMIVYILMNNFRK